MEGSVLEYLNFRILYSPPGFSMYQTDHIMDLVNECFPTGKVRKFDTKFWTDSTYEKEFMDEVLLTGNALSKAEMEYHGKFGHNLGRIHHIDIMHRIDTFYTDF